MKNIRTLIWKLSVLGDEIFNIFEQACFRSVYSKRKELAPSCPLRSKIFPFRAHPFSKWRRCAREPTRRHTCKSCLHCKNDWKPNPASALCSLNVVGVIVYNRAKVYMHQNFLKVVVCVIIIGQWNQTARFKYEMQVNVYFLSRYSLHCDIWVRVKRVIYKIWTGTLENSPYPDQTPQNTASDRCLYCLFQLQEVKG